MLNHYTQEQLYFLRLGYWVLGIKELAIEFNAEFKLNKTPEQVRSTLKNHKYGSGRKPGSKKERMLTKQEKEQLEFKARIKRLEQLRQIEAKIYLESTRNVYDMLRTSEDECQDNSLIEELYEYLNAA